MEAPYMPLVEFSRQGITYYTACYFNCRKDAHALSAPGTTAMNMPVEPDDFRIVDYRRLWSAVFLTELQDATSSRGSVSLGNNIPNRLRTIARARRNLLRFAFDPLADNELAFVIDLAGFDRDAIAYGILRRAKSNWPKLPITSSTSVEDKECPVARYVHPSGTYFYCPQPGTTITVKKFLAENPFPDDLEEATKYRW